MIHLFKKTVERENNACGRCQKQLGFRKHEPTNSNWGFEEERKLCKECFELIRDGIREFYTNYIHGYSRFPFPIEGKIFVQTFDA